MTRHLRIKLAAVILAAFGLGWAAGIYTASRMIGTFMPAVAEVLGDRR